MAVGWYLIVSIILEIQIHRGFIRHKKSVPFYVKTAEKSMQNPLPSKLHTRALCYTLSYKSVFIAKGAVLHVVSLRHKP